LDGSEILEGVGLLKPLGDPPPNANQHRNVMLGNLGKRIQE
jgi:hypothetical protein